MKRFLLNVFAIDGADVDVAMVSVNHNKALEWLRLREVFRDTERAVGGSRLYHLSISDYSARFFEGYPNDTSELVETIFDSHLEIPDEIEADFSHSCEPRLDGQHMHVYEGGIVWEAYLRHTDILIATATLPWEEIEKVANELEPRNNNGRKRCWWCGKATAKVPLFNTIEDECPDCRR